MTCVFRSLMRVTEQKGSIGKFIKKIKTGVVPDSFWFSSTGTDIGEEVKVTLEEKKQYQEKIASIDERRLSKGYCVQYMDPLFIIVSELYKVSIVYSPVDDDTLWREPLLKEVPPVRFGNHAKEVTVYFNHGHMSTKKKEVTVS